MESHGSGEHNFRNEEPFENCDFRSREVMVPVRTSWWFAWCSGDLTTEKGRRCQVLKIISASFLPGLLLLAQNGINLSQSQTVISEKEAMYADALYSFEIAKLIHFTQIERGTSAMFIGSDRDGSLILRLQDAYENTNDAIWSLSKWIPVTSQHKFTSRETYEQWIQDFRYEVFTSEKSIEEVVTFYTNANADFIDWIINSLKKSKGLDNWSKLVPYHFLTISKEAAGIERAIGSYLYARERSNDDSLLWYQEALVMGKTYLENCIFYSPFMEDLLKTHYYESQLQSSLEMMREQLLSNETLSRSVNVSRMWFDNMTLYINLLQDFHDRLGSEIIQQTEAEIQDKRKSQNVDIIMIVLMSVLLGFIFIRVQFFFKQLQSFVGELECRTVEYERERRKNEHLLLQMLPVGIAKKLLKTCHVEPEFYQSATVLFSDIYELAQMTSHLNPVDLIKVMNAIYQTVDERIEAHCVYKVETIEGPFNFEITRVDCTFPGYSNLQLEIPRNVKVFTGYHAAGDVYMVASGLPEKNGNRHMVDIAELALDLIKTMQSFRVPQLKGETLLLRIGFCTGPVACGVAGTKMPRYCLFGDTVNVASRMKSTSLPMKIHITEDTYKLLDEHKCYVFKRRGYVPVKGKGDMLTYWFLGRKGDPSIRLSGESISSLGYTAITNIEFLEDES